MRHQQPYHNLDDVKLKPQPTQASTARSKQSRHKIHPIKEHLADDFQFCCSDTSTHDEASNCLISFKESDDVNLDDDVPAVVPANPYANTSHYSINRLSNRAGSRLAIGPEVDQRSIADDRGDTLSVARGHTPSASCPASILDQLPRLSSRDDCHRYHLSACPLMGSHHIMDVEPPSAFTSSPFQMARPYWGKLVANSYLLSKQSFVNYFCRMKIFRLLVVVVLILLLGYLLSVVLCRRMIDFEQSAHQRTENWYFFYSDLIGESPSDEKIMSMAWKDEIDRMVLPEERDFPIAFSILMYCDVKQVLMLLRAIYRPQNLYCIHVDAKASPDVHLTVQHWRQHLPNLLVISNPVAVVHSSFTTLEADLMCMEALLRHSNRWRYFINLTGQEYPRRTNLELVRILRAINGSNLMNKIPMAYNRVMKRLLFSPPHNITIYKGAVHVITKREFVEYAIHDNRSQDLLDYIKDTFVPDESFFSTLNHNPQLNVPGAFLSDLYTGPEYPYVNRLKSWSNEYDQVPCHGEYKRLICIWGDDDFDSLTNPDDPTLFINKFIVSINGMLYKKIDRWFHMRQRQVYRDPDSINVTFYANLPQVSYHI